MAKKKVTVIGGGTGTFVDLSGLKNLPIDLAAVVTMMDSGGSTGRLRDQLGVLPPGDVRQCLVALSEASDLWRKLFVYRFASGDLQGHTFGNLFLSALEKVSSNYDEVLETASYVLKTKGHVYPVTYEKSNLSVEYANGHVVNGEGEIDENCTEVSRISRAFLQPAAKAHPKAIQRILESDVIIIGPGDLYTSIIPVFLAEGMSDAMVRTKAKIFYMMNLMTKCGQTNRYTAMDHLNDLVTYAKHTPDFVIYNTSPFPSDALQRYQKLGESIVTDDLKQKGYTGIVMYEDLIDTTIQEKQAADILTRSIIRHDPQKIARIFSQLLI